MTQHPSPTPGVGRAEILKAASSLGVLSSSGHSGSRLIAALCDPSISARDVAGLVRTEPYIYARVLRVANSPFYGQGRSVTTIERAAVILGIDAVRGIAAAVCLDKTLARSSAGTPMDMKALLQHSLATAVAAEWLGQMRRRALASDAFIAGLLHNIGVVVQVHLDPLGTRKMIESRRIDIVRDIRSLESEHAALGHEECAAVIFEAWQLPHSLVAAARHHHDPMAAPEAHRELTALVHLGANLALASGHTFALEPAPAAPNQPAMTELEFAEQDLAEVPAELHQRIAEMHGAMRIP